IQYNKQDLPNCTPIEELRELLNPNGVLDFTACAQTGEGVFETLKAVAKLILLELKKGGTA
ncbi:MAG: gliding-motility protein MglA, partial [Deltaproteobacteria bacterium]